MTPYTHAMCALAEALERKQTEIDRLNALCKEYRENGDRLARVADDYKAQIQTDTQAMVNALVETQRLQADLDHYKDAFWKACGDDEVHVQAYLEATKR